MSLFNIKFALSAIVLSVITTKLLRIYSKLGVIPFSELVVGCASIFAQDIIFVLALHGFVGLSWLSRQRSRYITTTFTGCSAMILSSMAAAEVAFFLVTGSELRWQRIGVVADLSGLKMLLTAGWQTFTLAFIMLLFSSWLAQNVSFEVCGWLIDTCWTFLVSFSSKWQIYQTGTRDMNYLSVSVDSAFSENLHKHDPLSRLLTMVRKTFRASVGAIVLIQIPMALIPFYEPLSSSMAWTLPLMPFAGLLRSSTPDDTTKVWMDQTLYSTLPLVSRNVTALGDPPQFSWLPSDIQIPGFEDWYAPKRQHYVATLDPLKISNMEAPLLDILRPSIKSIDIRHVMLVILESTRSDVFPFEKEGIISQLLAGAHLDKKRSAQVKDELTAMTPIANYLTGDTNHAFDESESLPGYIRSKNTVTTSTYTLKSLVGTLCGISPLAVDFNHEVSHHVYQPCLPSLLQALNFLNSSSDTVMDKSFASFEWKSLFMQSVTGDYDNQARLMPSLGYRNGTFITSEYLRSEDAKFGPTNTPDINYYGMPEVVLEDYIRDAFSTAKQNNERLFLTHLTSTSHHPFDIPSAQERIASSEAQPHEKRDLATLSKYMDAISYVDHWIGKILDVLDQQNVTNETLLVFVGDHGLSLPEQESVTPYNNPNIGNFLVPLIFSHPKLPKVDLEDAVISSQILPTILDLLSETGSLSMDASHAAYDLLRNYEGQSMLRPLRHSSPAGQGNWQVTVTNPGGTSIAVRDARYPHWRLIMPLSDESAWRFTDLGADPHEDSPFLGDSLHRLLQVINKENRSDTTQWIQEAADVSKWWAKENRQRWRYS